MALRCPKCAHEWTAGGVRAVGQARCPRCQHVFPVPEPPAPGEGLAEARLAQEPPAPGPQEPASSEEPAETRAAQEAAPAPAAGPEPEAAPVTPPGPPPLPGRRAPGGAPRPTTRALAVALGVAAALVLLLLVAAALKSLFGGRGSVGAYACYVPKNASFVACFDAAALRDCAVLERLGPSAEGLRKQVAPRLSDLKLEESQVAEIFVAGRPLGDPIVVIRASKGVDLAALPTGADTKVKTYRGIPYRCQRTEAGTCWVAQTGRSTYCFAPDEGEMAETLARLSRREKPVLSRDLRRVLKEVRQEQHYIAGSPQGTFPWARTAGLGLSFGATLRVRAVMIFPDEHAAGQFEKVIAAGRQQAIQRGRKAIAEADSAQKEALERAVSVLEGIKVNSKADAVLITAACPRNDVLGMAERAAGGLEETGDRMMRTLMKGTPQE